VLTSLTIEGSVETSVGNMPARHPVAELNATYDEPRSVMTNLVGQPLSKSEETRTGAKIRLEIDPTARDPESLEEEAVRRERSPAEREVRSKGQQKPTPAPADDPGESSL
jgi:hypothetical protein